MKRPSEPKKPPWPSPEHVPEDPLQAYGYLREDLYRLDQRLTAEIREVRQDARHTMRTFVAALIGAWATLMTAIVAFGIAAL